MKIDQEFKQCNFTRTIIQPKERFWKKVNKTRNCWIWTAGITTTGYGKFNPTPYQGIWIAAHRFSWKIHFGEIPKRIFVCHRCNFKLCVRPDHLYLATGPQNTADATRDGLIPAGEKHGMAKITEQDVKAIRALYEPRKTSLRTLGKRYNLTATQILRIVKYQTWKHLPPTS